MPAAPPKRGVALLIGIHPGAGPGGPPPTPPKYRGPGHPDAAPAAAPPKRSAPAPAPSREDPDAGGREQSVAVSPAAVLYHKGSVNCSTCEYMQPDGQCAVLKMPVAPEDWCNAHEDKAGDSDQGMGMMGGMGDNEAAEGEPGVGGY